MIDEKEFEDDSGDPELAFVRLEGKFCKKLHENLSATEDSSGAYVPLYIEYINHTLAAADALGLDILSGYDVPSHEERDIWGVYRNFVTAVDHYSVRIKIAHAHGRHAFSVALTGSEKEKLRHYVAQIKTVIDGSTLPQPKKEALLDKINAFLKSVDRDRTTLQALSELVLSAAYTASDAAGELEPTWKWVHLIAAMFGYKVEQQTGTLPPPRRQEKIEGPKHGRLPPPGGPRRRDLDDEIPF